MHENPRFAVLGAGAGGLAMCVDLALAGFDVGLYELPQFEEKIQAIGERGGIEASGAVSGFASPVKASTEIGEIVDGADVVMVTVPAFGHETFVEACLPHLSDGQILVFNTGYYAGLRFRDTLKRAGKGGVILAETMILPYTARVVGPARVHVDGKKAKLSIAALPATKTDRVLQIMKDAFPEFIPATNVLETSINNLNLVSHVPVTLLNKAQVERTSPFVLTVGEGVTPSVAKLKEAVDEERADIGGALGIQVLSIIDMLNLWGYRTTGESVYEVFQGSPQFSTFQYEYVDGSHQYLKEDLSYGLVPTASLAKLLGVPTPITRAMIDIFAVIDGIDYWRDGITAEKLGLGGMSSGEIVDLVTNG